MKVPESNKLNVNNVINRYGRCLELVPIDPNFHNISVGLYAKDQIATVWTFSHKKGVEERIRQIRDQLATLGDLQPVNGTHNQLQPHCGDIHQRPLKFLLMQAVEKDPSFTYPEGYVKDLRSDLMLGFESRISDGRVTYYITGEGEVNNYASRLRAITAGFVRYGEMDRSEDGGVIFSCGVSHDQLIRLLLPYARNVTGTQDMLESDSLRGQMTTGTLGFTPPT
jgi:hypothetical protein